ncbi:TPA: type-F conjugative transfer system protein TraW [Legionella pneumophila]|uniref:type-F conjugative transfer system protein TraW n=1 Tax=Legionella pneumophila TaxID=446 RepID=UPI000787F9FD|nr:type-F conjugative transfer system protein TraW [Legionella pneumophila]HAT4481980.1 type-F conjugative transfer system protein TraW [Legionella pneumophila]HAU0031585.1 type-F conjugative transfer system protein TraW [Legionella pneumophila]HAU0040779.1 type-F conjugative transfer system protein TraW [Legionella pneumophila]HAU0061623.1 type-F conjugative transfer system protein TraW [Legionella pneumophila]HAU0067706.1 type-F conjugative transfer system protein TraW [Legionella pneumophil
MRITCVSILLVMLCGQVNAKSFGVVGDVFPIAEKSFLALIEERLASLKASGELEAMNQRMLQTAAEHANRPKALNLPRTPRSTRHDYVPEMTLSQDITNENGRILYSKGTHINALQHMPSYTPCWLFFNADDEAQLNWAVLQKTQCANPKLILIGGAINTAEKKLNAVIYFDQAGRITSQLHITHVPAKVTRYQNHLVIAELAIKENGDVL